MKRIIGYLLCTAILVSSFYGCNPAEDSVSNETESTTTAETTPHGIPEELDFGGESFHVCGPTDPEASLYFVNEYTSDKMDAAVYNRNKKTENYLNITIGYSDKIGNIEELRILFQAGDDIYQQYILPSVDNSVYLTDGLLYNADKLPYINFDAEWWNKEIIDTLRLGNYTYLMVSDYLITNPYVVYFNREMVADNNLTDPYELTQANTWTIDKLVDMAIAVRNDVNGDGDFIGKDDIIGIYTYDSARYIGLPTGAARFMTERDENNRLISNMGNETTYTFLNQIYRLYENPGSFYNGKDKFDYANGNCLFTLDMMNKIEEYATIDAFTIGVVPCPKFNEEQTRYYCIDWSGALAVPSTIKNKELVGAFNEYMAWESGNEVVPTYYEKLLKTRYSSDLETREMIELIFDSVYLEPGVTYLLFSGFTGYAYICNTPLSGQNAYAAIFRREKKNINNSLENFYAGLAAIEALESTVPETDTESAN